MADDLNATGGYGQGRRVPPPGACHVCVFCEQTFSIGTTEPCPSACDGGEHESRSVHFFKPGRRDGLCAEPTGLVSIAGPLMCGFRETEEQIHPGGTADVVCRRSTADA